MRCEMANQCFSMCFSTLAVSQAVQTELHIFQIYFFISGHSECDYFGINTWIFTAEYFHPKLVKLPHTSLLWTFVAVHFCIVIPFCRVDSSTIQCMLVLRSDYRSCSLRT